MIKRKSNIEVDNTLNARVLYYDFFAGLFLYDLLIDRKCLLENQINILKTYPLSDENSLDFDILYKELRENGIKNFVFEYTYLFMLPFISRIDSKASLNKKSNVTNNKIGQKSIVLYLSYYIDGTIAGSGLTLAKQLVKKSKIRINDTNFKENEEHIGFLLLLMKHLLQNNNTSLSAEVFKECIKPMQYRIKEDLLSIGNEYLYFHIARLFDSFMSVELSFYS